MLAGQLPLDSGLERGVWRSVRLLPPVGNCCQSCSGALKPLRADRGQFLAALPELKRLLERKSARLQSLDHVCKLVPSLLVSRELGLARLLTGLAARRCHTRQPNAGVIQRPDRPMNT